MFRITLDPLAPSVILRAISRVRDVIDADVTPYTPMNQTDAREQRDQSGSESLIPGGHGQIADKV
jgi:hypothetical protein